jgi:hypothetical protein
MGNCNTLAYGLKYIKDLLSQEKQSNNNNNNNNNNTLFFEYYNLVKESCTETGK